MSPLFSHHFRFAWRCIRRSRGISSIKVIGLAMGLAAGLIILEYVQSERSFDQFHKNAERIVRITRETTALTSPALAPTLSDEVAGVETFARVLPTLGDVLLRRSDQQEIRFYESRFYFADPSLLDIFSFEIIRGASGTDALREIDTVVLSERAAARYFGSSDPIGQVLTLDIGFTIDLRVTAIMSDPPAQAHFRPEILASIASFEQLGFLNFSRWDLYFFHSYVLLSPAMQPAHFEDTIRDVVRRFADDSGEGHQVQPITEIHLGSKLQSELEPPGRPEILIVLTAIALLVIAMACINFVNLATAQFVKQARTSGIRKALGATRHSIAAGLLGESMIMASLAAVLALLSALILMPLFHGFIGREGEIQVVAMVRLVGYAAMLAIGTGVVAGIYPALLFASVNPTAALQGTLASGRRGSAVRKVLVVFQFCVASALLAGSFLIQRQLSFLQTADPGFDRSRTFVVAARLYGHATEPIPFETLIDEFGQVPHVEEVAATDNVPGEQLQQVPFFVEGMQREEEMRTTTWNLFSVGYDALEALGLHPVTGRFFSRDHPVDEISSVVINESAWRQLRAYNEDIWNEPVGRRLDRYIRTQDLLIPARESRVIGVVEDFHFRSMRTEVEPLVLEMNEALQDHVLVRLSQNASQATVEQLEEAWSRIIPGRPFEGAFLDDSYDEFYSEDRQLGRLVSLFTLLSIVIACLGVIGLAAYMADQRTREIGLRKSLGATSRQVLQLFIGDFLRLLLAGIALSILPTHLLMKYWLQSFAYHTSLEWWTSLAAGAILVVIVLSTVAIQLIRAAAINPATALRHV